MKQISIRSALMRIMAVLFVAMVSVSASAQYYMNVVLRNGDTEMYPVDDIDSMFISGKQPDHQYVDLGLSVKWASCNMGANSPEEYGDYYSWGETKPKEYYGWDAYLWGTGTFYPRNLNKYNTTRSYGPVDKMTILELNDDAPFVNWGAPWHIPTQENMDELCTKCKWTWTTLNGVNGYLVTSKVKGYTDRSIFLPASGIMEDVGSLYDGERGFYWTNSLTNEPMNANILLLEERRPYSSAATRSYGCCIRPVF